MATWVTEPTSRGPGFPSRIPLTPVSTCPQHIPIESLLLFLPLEENEKMNDAILTGEIPTEVVLVQAFYPRYLKPLWFSPIWTRLCLVVYLAK